MNSSALNLISGYGGDSSDDEVPGFRASTKRLHKDDSDEDEFMDNKRLPLPERIKQDTIKLNEVVDNPTLHEGRIRSFPHERGNWATYVYIPFEGDFDLEEITNNFIERFDQYNLKQSSDFHISLTKTVVLRHHWIDSFVNSIKKNVQHVRKFVLIFNNIKVYCNEERTRTFIGLQTTTGYDTLKGLVEILDRCLEDFKMPRFYDDASFHMSIAWCTGDYEAELTSHLPVMTSYFQETLLKSDVSNVFTYVKYLCCKSGNKLFQFPFT